MEDRELLKYIMKFFNCNTKMATMILDTSKKCNMYDRVKSMVLFHVKPNEVEDI